ncbi:MAG: hypothetical protein CMA64_06845 [Euryarchaeota archaeon]|nr:hypothetical protein [Euryarchaeota archaeon]
MSLNPLEILHPDWLLFALLIKHALADLILQSRYSPAHGDKIDLKTPKGYYHALDHGVLTFISCLFFIDYKLAIIIGIVDTILHFTIDYTKTRYVRTNDIKQDTKPFWIIQGIDQMAHYSCYMAYTLYLTL